MAKCCIDTPGIGFSSRRRGLSDVWDPSMAKRPDGNPSLAVAFKSRGFEFVQALLNYPGIGLDLVRTYESEEGLMMLMIAAREQLQWLFDALLLLPPTYTWHRSKDNSTVLDIVVRSVQRDMVA